MEKAISARPEVSLQDCPWWLRTQRILAVLPLLLTGCSSLPNIATDPTQSPGPAVQLEGAHGALTASQSKATLDRLRRHGAATDIFDHHLAREEAIVNNPLTTGNKVLLLQDGPATYTAMLAAIHAARDHINMETFVLEDDAIGELFAQALLDKQRDGVQVNLIHDSVGTLHTPASFFRRLSAGGVQTMEFNPVNPLQAREGWELDHRDHRKLLIVDGRIAFLGGINISGVYSGGSFSKGPRDKPATDSPAWRDTDLQLEGPVVAELQKLFLATWTAQRGEPLAPRNYFPMTVVAGREVVRAVGSSPDEPVSQMYATLLSAIASARTSVHMTNAYFVPDPQLLAALEAAARRGVDVTLILPSQSDSSLALQAGRSHYEDLLEAGVKIFERSGVILHCKTALIDGVWATVGSTNLDWRSFLHNQELNAVVLGQDFGRQVQAMFDKDLAASEEITADRWAHRPLEVRIKERLARVWEYWL